MTSRLGIWRGLAAAFVLFSVVAAGPTAARAQQVVDELRVVGTQRIDPATVNAYMQLQPGDVYDSHKADESLKSLFATGLFADVTLRREGGALIVQVVENPIINRIAFEGNRRLDDEVLEREVSLRPRVVYTRTKVQNDVQRLLDLYRRSGRFAATVEPKVIQLPENRVDLVFEITEGSATGIRAINFIGNREFSDSRLRGVIQTTQSVWYNFLSTTDTYDPDRVTFDRELLRRYYLSRGFADFRVVSAIAELTADREDFIITFTVEEGPRYRFGEIGVVSQIRGVEAVEVEAQLTTETGEVYNADEVEASIQAITDSLGEQGYAFVDVRPRVNRNREDLTIDVTYEVREGPRVFVERIDISGNVRTLDEVLRREFTLVEGDAFNTAKIRRTRQRLTNLGFFSRIDINNVPGSAPDRTIVNVTVEEQSTGELSLGAGFSSTAGVLGDISVRERNLLGQGLDLRAGLTIATREQLIDASFTDPYFLDRELSAGVDLFFRKTDFTDESSFQQQERGFALRAGYDLQPRLRHTTSYRFSAESIERVTADASPVVRAQQGNFTTSSVRNELFYDARDQRFNPTDGYFASVSNELAGLGGSEKFMKNEVGAGVYVPMFDSGVIGSVRGNAGHITRFEKNDVVLISQRFFLGAPRLRGFDTAGVGPRDLGTGDAIGGMQYYSGTAELDFPLGLPDEFAIRGSVFSDFGSAWGVKDNFPNLADENSLRSSVGVGLSWASPAGPIRVDFAQAVAKENFDRTKIFTFSFGTRF